MAGAIVRVPDQHTGHTGIHSDSHETGHAESNLGRGDIRDDCIPNDGNGKGEEHDGSSKLHAVGNKGDEHWSNLIVSHRSRKDVNKATPDYAMRLRYVPVTGVATAYGITDHNCVSFELAVMPSPLTIVGSFHKS